MPDREILLRFSRPTYVVNRRGHSRVAPTVDGEGIIFGKHQPISTPATMEKLYQYFGHIGFAGEDLDKIVEAFRLQAFQKNDLVVMEGKTSRHIGLVESGMFQYFVNKDGLEITSYVSVASTWLASVMSFVSEKPSLENIRALTDGAIFMISKPSLRTLVDEIPPFKNFYIALLEQSICGIDESRHDLIVLTADQRYAKLLRKEPHLLQLIPLQHLASMLGITARHLSRIRNNIR